jgi:hypothetical protein
MRQSRNRGKGKGNVERDLGCQIWRIHKDLVLGGIAWHSSSFSFLENCDPEIYEDRF